MSQARFIVGDALTVLRSMPDASVDLVLTSPPFLALRSYLPADHPDKAHEMGSESTPGAFIDALLDIAEECRRVLAPHGSLCFELGDTYAGSGGAGGDYGVEGMREGQPTFDGSGQRVRNRQRSKSSSPGGDGWPLDKCLSLIPESFRWSLAYGRNPFTGRQTEPWRVRNVVRWCRPNPPVGALGDKFRPATSEMVVACMSRTRYFDLDAVRYQAQGQSRVNGNGPNALRRVEEGIDGLGRYSDRIDSNPNGAPPLDWWEISTEPYKGHYATWPTALLIKPILAMCPQRVCTTCGEPSRRITEASEEYAKHLGSGFYGDKETERRAFEGTHGYDHSRVNAMIAQDGITSAQRTTTGWTDCGHDAWRAGIVLDPFAGSGTTLAVATGHGRDAIGIDLDERNADRARERVGMFLTVETFAPDPAAPHA